MCDYFLVKFKNSSCLDEFSYIEAFKTKDVNNILQAVKGADNIRLDGVLYEYSDSEYKPAIADGSVNVLTIYLN